MTTRAKMLGAAGAVVNGYTRDTRAVLQMEFPVFAFGSYGQEPAQQRPTTNSLRLNRVVLYASSLPHSLSAQVQVKASPETAELSTFNPSSGFMLDPGLY